MELTREGASLLLYLETTAVDHGGVVNWQRINDADLALIDAWRPSGYVLCGRIASHCIPRNGSLWVWLSDEAWADAARERKARALRMWAKRGWITTDEKRGEPLPAPAPESKEG